MQSLLDDDFFDGLGFAALNQAERNCVRSLHIKLAFDAIEERITATLNADELQELHAIQDAYGDAAAFDHLGTIIPTIDDVIQEELISVAHGIVDFRNEILAKFGHPVPAHEPSTDDTPEAN